jgi:hypothetical protein
MSRTGPLIAAAWPSRPRRLDFDRAITITLMPPDLAKYQEFLEAQAARLGSFAFDHEMLLWHYTTGAGLLGIVSSGTIYSTQVSCLNDSSEIRYGQDLFKKALTEALSGFVGDERVKQFLVRYVKLIEQVALALTDGWPALAVRLSLPVTEPWVPRPWGLAHPNLFFPEGETGRGKPGTDGVSPGFSAGQVARPCSSSFASRYGTVGAPSLRFLQGRVRCCL